MGIREDATTKDREDGLGRAGLPEADLGAVIGRMRRDASLVDRLWNEARDVGGSATLVVALGEASHALHRALMALQEPDLMPVSAPGPALRPDSRAAVSRAGRLPGRDGPDWPGAGSDPRPRGTLERCPPGDGGARR